MDVDEEFSLSKPKAPAKPGQEPEDVSLTHKTPTEKKPTVCKLTKIQTACKALHITLTPLLKRVKQNKKNINFYI